MKTYDEVKMTAENLVKELENKAKQFPEIFGENYGEKETRNFMDKINRINTLTYQEKCNIQNILNKVWDITPY